MMTKEQVEAMMDEVIKKYGFEARETILFCWFCEGYLMGLTNEPFDFDKFMEEL